MVRTLQFWCRGTSLNPGQGTRIPYVMQHGPPQKKPKMEDKSNNKVIFYSCFCYVQRTELGGLLTLSDHIIPYTCLIRDVQGGDESTFNWKQGDSRTSKCKNQLEMEMCWVQKRSYNLRWSFAWSCLNEWMTYLKEKVPTEKSSHERTPPPPTQHHPYTHTIHTHTPIRGVNLTVMCFSSFCNKKKSV